MAREESYANPFFYIIQFVYCLHPGSQVYMVIFIFMLSHNVTCYISLIALCTSLLPLMGF